MWATSRCECPCGVKENVFVMYLLGGKVKIKFETVAQCMRRFLSSPSSSKNCALFLSSHPSKISYYVRASCECLYLSSSSSSSYVLHHVLFGSGPHENIIQICLDGMGASLNRESFGFGFV